MSTHETPMWDGTHPHATVLYSAHRNGASLEEITRVIPEADIRSGRQWTQAERDAMSEVIHRYVPRGWSKQGAAWMGRRRRVPGPRGTCRYCGMYLASDGECDECGSQTAVRDWLDL